MGEPLTASELAQSLSDARINTSIWFAAQTILLYDYAITLRTEVHHVWPCPPSLGLFLFYTNRYLSLIEFIFYNFLRFNPVTLPICTRASLAAIWLWLVGMFISHLIIYLRTYAIWGRKRIIFYILLGLTIALVSALSTIATLQTMRTAEVVYPDSGGDSVLCAGGIAARPTTWQVLLFYGIFCINEGVVTVLTLIKAQQHLRQPTASWVRQLYENGIIYCVSMTALSVTNFIVAYRLRAGLRIIFMLPQRYLHAVFANRIIFLLLKHRHRGAPTSYIGSTVDVFSTIQYEATDDEFMSIGQTTEERVQTGWIR